MIVYIFMAWKLAASAPPEVLADTSNLVMSDIAWQGWWIIPTGTGGCDDLLGAGVDPSGAPHPTGHRGR